MLKEAPAPPAVTPLPPQVERAWAPRFWAGMNFVGWVRLLVRNRFRVAPRHWHRALLITPLSLFHSLWRAWQWILIGWRVGRKPLPEPPIFIIGHWRAGTTLLHELLVQDERFTYPTTFQCFAPNHFLLSENFAARWLKFLVPARRPMDNMAAGWQRPQEDEFALCNLGLPSPYLTIAFPNEPPQAEDYLTLEGLSLTAVRRWQRVFLRFLQEITYRCPKQLVLKSPPHTCRIEVLRQMFPDARFVHIVRDPRVVFPSTVHLWKKLYQANGLQTPTFTGLREHVLATFERMYASFERQRPLLPANRLCETRYEDLVRDPLAEIERVYAELELGDFAAARPALERYLAANQDYQTNRYTLTPEDQAEIERRWQPYFERYDYPRGQGTTE